jgi:hypothetical protein
MNARMTTDRRTAEGDQLGILHGGMGTIRWGLTPL